MPWGEGHARPENNSICKCQRLRQKVHRPGIEPGSPAWQARILPLNHRCFIKVAEYVVNIRIRCLIEDVVIDSNLIALVWSRVLGSIVVSIPACHAGDRGSIPRRGGFFWSADRDYYDLKATWRICEFFI